MSEHEPEAAQEPLAVHLAAPVAGVPELTVTDAQLAAYAARCTGSGPVAIDAERASGFKYSQRAYLIQTRTAEAGSALIDPIGISDFTPLTEAFAGREWILHAASQDLACLAEVGLVPERIFDTELAGRLLGRERVGLGPIVESELGLLLSKGHGAADWSTRPLPDAWLNYAALDVEVLIELRDVLAAELAATGKSDWAAQEFEHVRINLSAPVKRADPWRRTSGVHKVRKLRNLAVVRELWNERDRIAQRRDISPGRVLPDASIIEAATTMPASLDELSATKGFTGKGQQRRIATWWGAVDRARSLTEAELPQPTPASDGPPAPRNWADRDPEAFARLERAKAALAELSERVHVPVENLMQPDLVRRMCWQPPADLETALLAGGARNWQRELVAPLLRDAFVTGE